MSTSSPSWYIPGEEKQPAGPFTAEQLFQSWRAGTLSDTTMCWREGMAQWLPLAQVEPFASAIRSAAVSSRAMANVAPSRVLPKGKPVLPTPADPSPKWFTAPVVIAVCVCGAVALLAIVVAILATRQSGEGGKGAVPTGAQEAESPITGARTTTPAPDSPLAGPSGDGTAGRLLPDDAKDALQGVWIAESLKASSNELPADAFKHVQFTFQGNRLVIWWGFHLEDASGPEMVCTYSVDPEQSPKRLDFTPRGETTPNVGIYDLKGDRLTVCFQEGGSARGRPTEFATPAHGRLILIALKKRTPEEQRELLARWIKQTKDEDRHSRLEAIVLLARMAPESKAARDTLAEALWDKDKEVRMSAAGALSFKAVLDALFKMGAGGVPVLREVVRNGNNPQVYLEFAKSPEKLEVDAIPTLIEVLHDSDRKVGFLAAVGLARVGQPAIPALTQSLKDHDGDVRDHAAVALFLMGAEAEPALPALRAALTDYHSGDYAALALARIGSEGVSVLVDALRDKDRGVRNCALLALGEGRPGYSEFCVGSGATELGPEAYKAIPDLIKAVNAKEGNRDRAAKALGRIGPPAKAAVPDLIQLVEEGNSASDGIWALGQIGPAAAEAVPLLTRLLNDPQKNWLYPATIKALGKIGPAAAGAVPALRKLLDDRRKNLLYAAVTEAIRKIESPGSQPPESLHRGPLKEIAVDLGGGVKLEMVLIPAGEFLMGTPGESSGEMPQHRVRITRPFCLGKYLVTQEQWEAVMGSNPSKFKGPKNPVENVSWDDCQAFIAKLNANTGEQQGKFLLPTEAQWEYACRAGSTTKYYFGDDERQLGDYGWYDANSEGTHPVGKKKPNAWGLYDMHGNVGEWCADYWDGRYYEGSPTNDPTGPNGTTGWLRVRRGGSWNGPADWCRSASRTNATPGIGSDTLGLRICRFAADKGATARAPTIEPPSPPGDATPIESPRPGKPQGPRPPSAGPLAPPPNPERKPVATVPEEPPSNKHTVGNGPLSGTWQASGGSPVSH